MIDPVIFSVNILGLQLTLHWYGVLVMLGVLVGGWFAEREITRRGENGALVWDAMVWVLPAGVIGARLWYVMNTTLGGNRYFLENPFITIGFFGLSLPFPSSLAVWQGGLHFFGGLLFGAVALFYFMRRNKLDPWLFLDAIAPVTLIGQAVARPANFINQELYGQPTTLPWGIPIDAAHRLPIYSDLAVYPVATTRFHPTFAYEMIWNFLAAALLLWAARRFADRIKPGTILGGWLILAGLGRVLIEFFRPDQPKIGDSIISYSALVSALMAVAGILILLARFGKIRLGSLSFPDAYVVAQKPAEGTTANVPTPVDTKPEEPEEQATPKRVARRTSRLKKK